MAHAREDAVLRPIYSQLDIPKASLSMHSRDDAWLGGALRYRGYGGWTLCLNDGCTVGWDNVPSQMVEGKGEKEGKKGEEREGGKWTECTAPP